MGLRRGKWAAGVGVLLTSLAAAAETYFVDAARPDDQGNGLGWTTAKKTLQAGVDLVTGPGDEVRVRSGTYPGGLRVKGDAPDGEPSAWIRVRSDDGAGGYGDVVVRGAAAQVWGTAAVVVGPDPWSDAGPSYWRFEHLTFEATPGNGCAFWAAGTSAEPYPAGLALIGCRVLGVGTQAMAVVFGYDDVEIGGCEFDGLGDPSGGSEGALMINGDNQTEPDCTFQNRPWPAGYRIHHCHFHDIVASYNVINLYRILDVEVHHNWFDGCATDTGTVRLRHGTGFAVWNNVIRAGSDSTGVFVLRGMTSEPQGGPCGVYGAAIFNNTVDLNGHAIYDIVHNANDTNDAVFQNNLIVGNPSVLVGYWDSPYCDECPGPDTVPANNIARHNTVTGATAWLEDGLVGWTQVSNQADVSTGVLQLQGEAPWPYYGLTASLDGTADPPQPPDDHRGRARGVPPDLGAFEHGEPNGLAPAPPGNLRAE